MNAVKNILGRVFCVYMLALFVITMLAVLLPIWIISFMPEPKRAKALHKVFRGWMGVYLPLIGCPVRRRGAEKLHKDESYVVLINHNSLMDIPVSTPWIPGPNKTLAKVEMSRVPLFGIIYKTGSILVDRKKPDSRRESFNQMQKVLEQGIHLCLYPEGTRNKTPHPIQPFFDGAFITAIKAQKPIAPALLFNTKKILPVNKKFYVWPSPIDFHFLEPIPTKGLTLNDVAMLKEKVHGIMSAYYVAHQNNKA